MENPFFFGNEVYEEDFCNRRAELEELRRDVAAGMNVLLYAPRRFGKTSLLRALQASLEADDNYRVVFFDIFRVSSPDEFVQKYFGAIAEAVETNREKALQLFGKILKIRPGISFSFDQKGDPVFGLNFSRKDYEKTFEEVVDLPAGYARRFGKKLLVIFDEFQEIANFGLETKLRSIIQSHSRDVSYIFCGSKKSILLEMFNDEKRAFYKSTKHFLIGEIDFPAWQSFIMEKFTSTGKTISTDLVRRIYDLTKGFPYYMQQLAYELWAHSDAKVLNETLDHSLDLILQREEDLYSLIWSALTPFQKKTLKYLIDNDGENLYSNENLTADSLTSSTLKSALEGLMKKDVIDRQENTWHINDPFLQLWLERL